MLCEDQARYAATLTRETGLDRDVVRAWIAAASGPGVYRADHQYIAPAGVFADTDSAARATAQLLERRGHQGLALVGPLPQMHELGDDPELPGEWRSMLDAWMQGHVG